MERLEAVEAEGLHAHQSLLILPVLHGLGKIWQVNMAYKIPVKESQKSTGKTSEYTKAIAQLRDEIRFSRSHAMENMKIPVGQEELSKRDARNRFGSMGPEEKQAWIRENSLDSALDLVRPPESQQPEMPSPGALPLNL
jgi:hypothetical protein